MQFVHSLTSQLLPPHSTSTQPLPSRSQSSPGVWTVVGAFSKQVLRVSLAKFLFDSAMSSDFTVLVRGIQSGGPVEPCIIDLSEPPHPVAFESPNRCPNS